MSACERATAKYPEGRTGTSAGYTAHRDAGEPACQPCKTAHTAKSTARRKALPPDELVRHRELNNAARRRWRQRDRGGADDARDKFRDVSREIIRQAKDVPCADCGVRYPYYVMQFDHRDDSQKSFNIGAIGPTCSRERLAEEIAKCDVVCANCHAERSHRLYVKRGLRVAG